MTNTKRSKRVWQCTHCGYWADRIWNLKRHNANMHGGQASMKPAYAVLVTEPSWHIMPIPELTMPYSSFSPFANDTTNTSPLLTQQTSSLSSSSPPTIQPATRAASVVAPDTILPKGAPMRNQTGNPFSPRIADTLLPISQKQQQQPGERDYIKEMNSDMEEMLKLAENFRKMSDICAQGQRQQGWGGTNQMAPVNIPPASGYIGRQCKRCLYYSVSAIPPDRDPATYLIVEATSFSASAPFPASWSPHNDDSLCTGRPILIGEEANQQYQNNQESALLNLLFTHATAQLRGKGAILVAKKLDRAPPASLQTFKVDNLSPAGVLATRAIQTATITTAALARISDNAINRGSDRNTNNTSNTDNNNLNAGALPISHSDLLQFLHHVRATVGIFEITTEDGGNTEYYSVSVSAQTTAEDMFAAAFDKMISIYMKRIEQSAPSSPSTSISAPTATASLSSLSLLSSPVPKPQSIKSNNSLAIATPAATPAIEPSRKSLTSTNNIQQGIVGNISNHYASLIPTGKDMAKSNDASFDPLRARIAMTCIACLKTYHIPIHALFCDDGSAKQKWHTDCTGMAGLNKKGQRKIALGKPNLEIAHLLENASTDSRALDNSGTHGSNNSSRSGDGNVLLTREKLAKDYKQRHHSSSTVALKVDIQKKSIHHAPKAKREKTIHLQAKINR